MRLARLVLALLSLSVLPELPLSSAEKDPHSFSNPLEVRVTHIDWKFGFDFQSEWLPGEVQYTLNRAPESSRLILDTRRLQIDEVLVCDDEGNCKTTDWTLGSEHADLGIPLEIALEPNTTSVKIRYKAWRNGEGFGWAPAEQTATKKFGNLFFLASSHNLRTLFPCQDTPANRFTFTANISAPPGILVLMSAPNPTVASSDGHYRFTMNDPVPSYLFGFLAGDFEFRPLTPRLGIYAEANQLETAAARLQSLPKIFNWLEQWLGRFPWQRHDIFFSSRTFPIGGMETILVNYLNSSTLTGNETNIFTIIHELIHGWSGNLANAENLNHFWLNEGLTVYIERRTIEEFYGKDMADIDAVDGWLTLQQERLANHQQGRPDDNALYRDLSGKHPSSKLAEAPYERGYLFFRALEQLVGRPRLDRFIRLYFDSYRNRSINSEEFIKFTEENLIQKSERSRFDIRWWIYSGALPNDFFPPQSTLHSQLVSDLAVFLNGDLRAPSRWATLTEPELLVLLSLLKEKSPTLEQLLAIKAVVDPGRDSYRTHIQGRWFEMVARAEMIDLYPEILRFLSHRPLGAYTIERILSAWASTQSGRIFFSREGKDLLPTLHPHTRVKCQKALQKLAEP